MFGGMKPSRVDDIGASDAKHEPILCYKHSSIYYLSAYDDASIGDDMAQPSAHCERPFSCRMLALNHFQHHRRRQIITTS